MRFCCCLVLKRRSEQLKTIVGHVTQRLRSTQYSSGFISTVLTFRGTAAIQDVLGMLETTLLCTFLSNSQVMRGFRRLLVIPENPGSFTKTQAHRFESGLTV